MSTRFEPAVAGFRHQPWSDYKRNSTVCRRL